MPSQRYPPQYRGQIRSTGYLARNTYKQNEKAPSWKGRAFAEGLGWLWIAGWTKKGRNGAFLSLLLQPMAEADVEKYCRPKPQAHDDREHVRQESDLLEDDYDPPSSPTHTRTLDPDDIPF